MIVVNKDFRDWFLAYHLEQHLQKGTHTLLCLIGGEGNAYLREVLLRYPMVNTIRDLSATAFGQAALVILETLPIRQQEAALRSASTSGAAVWDIISLYTVYETVRLPTDYLLDEFHTTMEADWLNYTVCRDRISCDYISRYIAKRYQDGQQTLFNKLEIETVNRCNGKCAFCPVNRTADPRPYQRMEESLFLQILGQLEQLSYTGALGIFSNNEPLLDVRFPAFARSARKALPDAFLYIYIRMGVCLPKQICPCCCKPWIGFMWTVIQINRRFPRKWSICVLYVRNGTSLRKKSAFIYATPRNC